MPDKLPSLFDFDDEDFFQKPVEPEVKTGLPIEKQPVAKEPSEQELQMPELTEVVPANEALTEEAPLDNRRIEVTEIREKEEKENLPKDYIKPKLELPGQPDTDSFDDIRKEPAFDKQIGNAYQPKAAAFTFEPRIETKAAEENIPQQPELEETKNTGPTVLQDTQNEVESEEENIPEEETIMEPLPEWDLDKNYYTIGEVAQLFDVNVSHIRFWTTEFKMKTRTTRKGDRLYTPAQIGELRLIHHLVKVKKYTLKGAKEILKSGNVQLEKKLNLKEELQKLYQELSALKDSL